MSKMKVFTGVTTIDRPTKDGAYVPVRGSRDGSLYHIPYFQGLAMEGRVFVANAGTGTTVMQGNAAYSATAAEFNMDIPHGITVLPISIEVTLDAKVDDEDLHIHALASRTLAEVSSGTLITQVPLRLDNPIQSKVTCYAAIATMTSIATTGHYEFWRRQTEYGAAPVAAQSEEGELQTFRWSAIDDGVFPMIVGNGALGIHAVKTTASNLFITVVWAELVSNTIV